MVELWVQPLKRRARLLCNYVRIEDLSRETMEMLKAGEVMKRVIGLVTPATVVVDGNAVEAFSATYWPNLVSPLFSPYLPFVRSP